MTIIIAQKTSRGVLMGADNRTSDGQRSINRAIPKLVQVSPRIAFGTSGHVRSSNILRERMHKIPIRSPGFDDHDYECALGEFFREVVKGEYPEGKLWTLLAVDNEIYDIGPDGGFFRVGNNFSATGDAELVAFGALFAWNRTWDAQEWTEMPAPLLPDSASARQGVELALNACAAFIDTIKPPWSFLETIAPTTSAA